MCTLAQPSQSSQAITYADWLAAGRPVAMMTKIDWSTRPQPQRSHTANNPYATHYTGRRLNGQFRSNAEARYAKAGLA